MELKKIIENIQSKDEQCRNLVIENETLGEIRNFQQDLISAVHVEFKCLNRNSTAYLSAASSLHNVLVQR